MEAEGLLEAIDEVVPKGLPQQLREDVCQEMLVDILSKKFSIRNAHNHVKDYIRAGYKDSAQNQFLESLDRPVGDPDGDFTLLDTLDAPVVDEAFTVAPDAYAKPYQYERKRKGRQPSGELIPCKQCGTPFYVTPHLYKTGKRYCSKVCFYEHGKGPNQVSYPATKPCLNCGTLDYVNRVNNSRKKYCSRKCALQFWHGRATREGLCHWCGKPSSPQYKNACNEHLTVTRETSSRNGKDRRERLALQGICQVCGKEPCEEGYAYCVGCRQNNIEASASFRKKQRAKTARRRKRLGLINIQEAAVVAGITYGAIHHWIERGHLSVAEVTGVKRTRGLFWVKKEDVLRVTEEMRNYTPPRGTHCRKGHLFSGDNLYVHPKTGNRQCRTCRLERQRRYAASRP